MSAENGSIALRACPTLIGHVPPLIAQLIPLDLCEARQRGMYHKCHRCVFQGRPADEITCVVSEASNGKHKNGVFREAAVARPAQVQPGTREVPREMPREMPREIGG